MQLDIRTAVNEDVGGIIDIYGPIIQNSTTSFELTVPTNEEMALRVQKTLSHFPWLVLMQNGRVAGYAYAGPHRSRWAYQWSTELSVYVHPDFHRRQIGRRLYTSLMALLNIQGYRNFLAGVTLPNEPSAKFHAAFGFKQVGVYHGVGYKFGAWHDVAWWELSMPGADPPTPPLSMAEASLKANWVNALKSGLNI